jgi:hypothetical protein
MTDYNQRIRKVTTNGIITTVAGNGVQGFSGDGGSGNNASMSFPRGLAVDNAGNTYITDGANNRIRKLAYVDYADRPTLTLANVMPNNLGNNYSVIVTGADGSVTSSVITLAVILPPQNFTASPGTAGLQLQFTGTTNYPYILQSATNLTPPVAWQTVLTNPADTSGNWSFTVPNTQAAPACFYRVSVK